MLRVFFSQVLCISKHGDPTPLFKQVKAFKHFYLSKHTELLGNIFILSFPIQTKICVSLNYLFFKKIICFLEPSLGRRKYSLHLHASAFSEKINYCYVKFSVCGLIADLVWIQEKSYLFIQSEISKLSLSKDW